MVFLVSLINKLSKNLNLNLSIFLVLLFILFNSQAYANQEIKRFSIGDEKAPIVIYEFVSLACSHCATFNAEILPKLKSDYVEKKLVKIIFIDVPFGPIQNTQAHALLYKSKNISQFELLSSLLFKNQQAWLTTQNPQKEIATFARLVGLTNEDIQVAFEDTNFHESLKNESEKYLKTLNIQGTPSLLITKAKNPLNSPENIKMEGLGKYENIKNNIDKLLK